MFVFIYICIYLKLVAEVNDNGVAHGRNVYPSAVFEELEAADGVVLEEQDDAAGVGVSSEPLDQVRLRAGRVVADFSAEVRTFGAMEGLFQVPFFQSEILTQQV